MFSTLFHRLRGDSSNPRHRPPCGDSQQDAGAPWIRYQQANRQVLQPRYSHTLPSKSHSPWAWTIPSMLRPQASTHLKGNWLWGAGGPADRYPDLQEDSEDTGCSGTPQHQCLGPPAPAGRVLPLEAHSGTGSAKSPVLSLLLSVGSLFSWQSLTAEPPHPRNKQLLHRDVSLRFRIRVGEFRSPSPSSDAAKFPPASAVTLSGKVKEPIRFPAQKLIR